MCGGNTSPAGEAELQFPFGQKPAHVTLDVTDSIKLLRIPNRMAAGDVNVMAVREASGPYANGWTIVDTGPDTPEAREAWAGHFDTTLEGRPIRRVIVTHGHSDHYGLAGFLCKRNKGQFWAPRLVWLLAGMEVSERSTTLSAVQQQFLKRCGYTRAMLDAFSQRPTRPVEKPEPDPLPATVRPIVDGDSLEMGGCDWTVTFGHGHAPDHAVLVQKETNIAIVGDQVLPMIAPNVSVQPYEPDADPLRCWQTSSQRLSGQLGTEVLLLPGHGAPFRGGAARIATILRTQDKSLERLATSLKSPKTTIESFEAQYRRSFDPVGDAVALAQTYAYLNRLRYSGRARLTSRPDGIALWG